MMKFAFRWYGDSDPIPLNYIKQIPNVVSVVSAIYDIPVGQVWPLNRILALKKQIQEEDLTFEVVESLPVHEDIKIGLSTRDLYINNYKESIKQLAKAGIKVITYNFMPIFDWLRTSINKVLDDGSTTLSFNQTDLQNMNPLDGELALPGWDMSYSKQDLTALFEQYRMVNEDKLWDNLSYFLKEIIPVAEQVGIKMAIHPDDPPFSVFDLPRIITCEKNIDRFLNIIDSPSNGLALCVGSLGSIPTNHVEHMVKKYATLKRIHFVHMRNVKRYDDGSGFEESAHPSQYGSLDMVKIIKNLYDADYDGYLRPDHGRMIFGEKGKPGYGLYDRALGVTYLYGIYETLVKIKGEKS